MCSCIRAADLAGAFSAALAAPAWSSASKESSRSSTPSSVLPKTLPAVAALALVALVVVVTVNCFVDVVVVLRDNVVVATIESSSNNSARRLRQAHGVSPSSTRRRLGITARSSPALKPVDVRAAVPSSKFAASSGSTGAGARGSLPVHSCCGLVAMMLCTVCTCAICASTAALRP